MFDPDCCSLRQVRPLRLWMAAVLCMVFVCGCGAEVYEKRLAETVKHYEYMDKINSAVVPTPFNADGISIRVPKKFTPIIYDPRSRKKQDADEPEEESTDEPKDPRQPDYMEIELPGLEAAWKMMVSVPLGDKDVQRPVYLYAMTNAKRWRRFKKEGAKDPKELHKDLLSELGQELDLIDALQEATGAGMASGDPKTNRYFSISVPDKSEERYTAPKNFTAINLVPEDRTYHDVETEFHVYLYSEGDAFAALLLVVPLNANPSERILERMEIALHTMNAFKPDVTAGAAAGGNPATGGGGGKPVGGSF